MQNILFRSKCHVGYRRENRVFTAEKEFPAEKSMYMDYERRVLWGNRVQRKKVCTAAKG